MLAIEPIKKIDSRLIWLKCVGGIDLNGKKYAGIILRSTISSFNVP